MTGAPERILRVHELTVLVARRLMEGDSFKDLWIEGEVSEATVSAAGHAYFTLRDNTSQIRCSLFATAAANVALMPAHRCAAARAWRPRRVHQGRHVQPSLR